MAKYWNYLHHPIYILYKFSMQRIICVNEYGDYVHTFTNIGRREYFFKNKVFKRFQLYLLVDDQALRKY